MHTAQRVAICSSVPQHVRTAGAATASTTAIDCWGYPADFPPRQASGPMQDATKIVFLVSSNHKRKQDTAPSPHPTSPPLAHNAPPHPPRSPPQDIDGVICCNRISHLEHDKVRCVIPTPHSSPVLPLPLQPYPPAHPHAQPTANTHQLMRLKTMCDKTGAVVVLSSDWRRSREGRDAVGMALRSLGIRCV